MFEIVTGPPPTGVADYNNILLEETPPTFVIGLKLRKVGLGFVTSTIANPSYGSGVDFPLEGFPTYQRGEAIAGRRYNGIIFP